jgi:hypothetical protein
MDHHPVFTEAEVEAWYEAVGCKKTDRVTATGRVWHGPHGQPFLLPFSDNGYYPQEILWDLDLVLGRLSGLSLPIDGKKN